MDPKAPCAICSRCPLKDRPLVPSFVPENFNGTLMIGEAPGAEEVREKVPFVGPSGQLLSREYNRAGGDFSGVARTNAVLCRPRQTPEGAWTPPDAAIAACAPRLRNEIRGLEPEKIVTLGKVPARIMSVLHKKPIEEGAMVDHIIGAPHPAFILRRPSELPRLQRVLRRVLGNEDPESLDVLLREEPEVRVINELDELERVVAGIEDNEWVCFDIETNNLDWYDKPYFENKKTGQVGKFADNILCLAFTTGVGYGWIVTDELLEDVPASKIVLTNFFKRVNTVAHNGKFDTLFLRANGVDSHVDVDTLAAHYALDETPGTHGLKELAQNFFGLQDYEAKLIKRYLKTKNDDYSKIPPDALYKYAVWDVCATLALAIKFKPSLKRQGMWEAPFTKLYMPALKTLTEVEWNGFMVDVPAILFWKDRFLERAEIVRRKLGDIAGDSKFNPGSTPQCQKLLFEDIGLPRTTAATSSRNSVKQGVVSKEGSTNKKVLEEQLKGAHPAVDLIIEYRALKHKVAAYFDNMLGNVDRNHRLHTQYLLQGTECVVGSSLVWTSKGLQRAEDMWKDNRLDVFPDVAARMYKSPDPVPVLRVDAESGYSLTCTPNHMFMTSRGWVRADDLKEGIDEILTWNGDLDRSEHRVFDPEIAMILGIITAEGFFSYSGNICHANIATTDPNVIDLIAKYGWTRDVNRPNTYEITGEGRHQKSMWWRSHWNEDVPQGAHFKRVPDAILESSREDVLNFLKGYTCDAHIGMRKISDVQQQKIMQWSTTSERLAREIQQLVQSLGYLVRIGMEPRKKPSNHHTKDDAYVPFHYTIQIRTEHAVRMLKEMGGALIQLHIERTQTEEWLSSPTRTGGERSPYRKVKKVEGAGTEYVYDFTVPETSAYVVNGLYVHNTGRLSSRNPALQTIPRGTTLEGRIIRSCFIAPPGRVLIDADYDQAELRVFAALTLDPFLLRVYREGRDLHTEVTVAMYGTEAELGEFAYKEARMTVKQFNFGWAFGAGLERARQVLPDKSMAAQFYNDYEAQMPVAAAWRRQQTALADRQKYVISRTGRKRRFPEQGYGPEAINAPVQSGASDCTLVSAGRLVDEGYMVLLLVHDELLVETDENKADETLAYVEQVMAEEGERLFPEVKWSADGKITKRWAKKLTDQEVNAWMESGGLEAVEEGVLI